MERRCGNCEWSVRREYCNDDFVECHYNAPRPRTENVDNDYECYFVLWPLVDLNSDFCSTFTAKQ